MWAIRIAGLTLSLSLSIGCWETQSLYSRDYDIFFLLVGVLRTFSAVLLVHPSLIPDIFNLN